MELQKITINIQEYCKKTRQKIFYDRYWQIEKIFNNYYFQIIILFFVFHIALFGVLITILNTNKLDQCISFIAFTFTTFCIFKSRLIPQKHYKLIEEEKKCKNLQKELKNKRYQMIFSVIKTVGSMIKILFGKSNIDTCLKQLKSTSDELEKQKNEHLEIYKNSDNLIEGYCDEEFIDAAGLYANIIVEHNKKMNTIINVASFLLDNLKNVLKKILKK